MGFSDQYIHKLIDTALNGWLEAEYHGLRKKTDYTFLFITWRNPMFCPGSYDCCATGLRQLQQVSKYCGKKICIKFLNMFKT